MRADLNNVPCPTVQVINVMEAVNLFVQTPNLDQAVTGVGKVEQEASGESESRLGPSHGCLVSQPAQGLEAENLAYE